MADKFWPVLVIALLLAIAVGFMLLGWRNRRRRQSALDVVAVPPAEIGEELGSERVLYSATTLAEQPLERIVVGGLGFRARGLMRIARGGVVLDLAGTAPAFIPLADIRGVGLASWTIDKGVDEDGLVFVRWELAGTLVDSYFRADDPDRLLAVLTELSPSAAAAARTAHPDTPQEEAPA
ncbi:PH-like domain-containing protein [Protaetiibacter intestinalis]|uniref:PH domain-containing protein n=1 Tax=Protaetiibacter intestinalis TaxID=2419774 RepID=A0A387B5V7_9MICO|nr:hypothetical protein [Protaetiibacter intestinalis]AYF99104.1 hypothetical protein D7I47_13115 [Protaetiibacter intestinalis]